MTLFHAETCAEMQGNHWIFGIPHSTDVLLPVECDTRLSDTLPCRDMCRTTRKSLGIRHSTDVSLPVECGNYEIMTLFHTETCAELQSNP